MVKKRENFSDGMYIEHGKIPPQAVDIEETVLGTIMSLPCPDTLFSILFADIFYKDAHRRICQVLIDLRERNAPLDLVSVTNELKVTEQLELVGGPYYLTMMMAQSISPFRIEYLIRILQQQWIKRNVIRISSEATRDAYEDSSDCFDVVDYIQDQIDSTMKLVLTGRSTDIKDSTEFNLQKIKKAMLSKTLNYYQTGMKNFDNIVKLTGNNIILIAAKNGSGKTKFVISLISMLFNRYPKKIGALWYAMEDGDDKIVRNLVAKRIRLTDEQQMSKGYKLKDEQFDLISSMSEEIGKYNIEFVNEKSAIKDIGKNFKKFRSRNKHNELNFLIIDNIMLLADNQNPKYKNQNEKDDAISGEIDSWNIKTGRKSDPVVILIHHFTDEQQKEGRLTDAYRPIEKHIKGSSRYRDIATMIMMANRPAQYSGLMAAFRNKKDILNNLFLLDITKNRNGNTGLVRYFVRMGYNIFDEF